MNNINVVLVAIGSYRNFPVRIMHPLLRGIQGVKVHTVFFKDFTSRFFSHPTQKEKKIFRELITDIKPDLVGFSVLYPFFPMVKILIDIIRNCFPSTLIILGGVYPTIDPEQCLKETDMVCIGEGEGMIVDLVKALRDKKPYFSIKNLWIKTNDGIVKNAMRPLLQDLDSLPFTSYGDDSYYFINKDKLTQKDPLLLDNELFLLSSRGCPYVCSYCVNSILRPLYKGLGQFTRRRSVNSLIKEIKQNLQIPQSRINYLLFLDEVFSDNKEWLDEFCYKYKEEINLQFQVNYNPLDCNEIVIKQLVEAGLDTISFGIQTASDHIRNNIFHRSEKNSTIVDFIKMSSRYKIIIRPDFIIDNPYETESSLKDIIKLLWRFPKELSVSLYSLQFFPKYALTNKAIEDKHIQPIKENDICLIEKTANTGFVPTLRPHTKKQILKNIIWLVANNHIKDEIVRHGVFGSSLSSRLCLFYMNIKAVILSKIVSERGIAKRNRFLMYLIKSISFLFKGDWQGFWMKAKRRLGIKTKL